MRRYGDATLTYNGIKASVSSLEAEQNGDEDYDPDVPIKSTP